MESALQTSRNADLSPSSNMPSSQLSKNKHQDSAPRLTSQESSSPTLYQAGAHIMAWLQISPRHLPPAMTPVRKERCSCALPTWLCRSPLISHYFGKTLPELFWVNQMGSKLNLNMFLSWRSFINHSTCWHLLKTKEKRRKSVILNF